MGHLLIFFSTGQNGWNLFGTFPLIGQILVTLLGSFSTSKVSKNSPEKCESLGLGRFPLPSSRGTTRNYRYKRLGGRSTNLGSLCTHSLCGVVMTPPPDGATVFYPRARHPQNARQSSGACPQKIRGGDTAATHQRGRQHETTTSTSRGGTSTP